MATVGLYGSSSSGVVAAASGSESIGLYGNGTSFGGSYFEWFIFQVADTQPATPTGGSWDFNTNTGTPPTGWSSTPPANPTNIVWVSIALVNSKNVDNLTWSVPGKFSYSSGLPILSGSGTPGSGDGQSDQLYIQLDTTPQTIWFKESGTWTRLTGSTLYVDTTSNQTIAGTKTFSSQIQGSISGTASNVTGIVGIANGGTGSTTATGARTALGAAASGANSDITSLSGLTTALSIAQGGTGATTANGALSNLGGIGTITSTDGSITVTPAGTTVNLAVSEASPASTVLTPVRNTTGATLTKGTVVYISGATGQIATVSKALASSDATSAQTLGMITSDLPNNTNGYVTVFGLILDIDTSAYADGAQLYLSGVTAGAVTATKPSAPTHLVYVAVVEYSHAIHGKLLVKVQNGYELDELHNVSITSPATGQTIIYNSGTGLWSNNTVSLTAGVNGTLPIANGGTGQTTANAAFNALAPSQTGNSGKYLTTDGTNTSWATNPLGTVTSVGGTGTVSGITLSGTVTTSGNLTLGGALDLSAYNGAGAFTTLSASGAVTLSGGTANGVAYLNGSKVLTTGSALTFDGTNLGVNCTATNFGANYRTIEARGATTTTSGVFRASSSDASQKIDFFIDSGVGTLRTDSNHPLAFSINNSEQMRLTSTGLGIGTSSPGYKLDVRGGNAAFVNSSGLNVYYGYGLGTSQYGYISVPSNGSGFKIGTDTALPLLLETNGSTRATIDSSGNLGLGVTPSAWISTRRAFQLGLGAYLQGDNNGYTFAEVGANTYLNGSGTEVYIGSNYATKYRQIVGTHVWYTAPSGTAGNAISFTQAMTLDASGNLGVGVTSPGYRGHFRATGTSSIVRADRSENNSLYLEIGADGNGGVVNGSPAVLFQTAGTERARIDTSGNLGLGVTPSAWGAAFDALEFGAGSGYSSTTSVASAYDSSYFVNNAYYADATGSFKYVGSNYATQYQQYQGQHRWFTAPSGTAGNAISFTQAMTLNAGGSLLIGATSGAARLFVASAETKSQNATALTLSTSDSSNAFELIFSRSTNSYYKIQAVEQNVGYRDIVMQSDGGNLLVGTTSQLLAGRLSSIAGASANGGAFQTTASANNYTAIACSRNNNAGNVAEWWYGTGTQVGTVAVTSVATIYNTTSDYRLKTFVEKVSGSGERIDALNPVVFDWKSNGQRARGFFAHEFQAVYADSVTGEKDAVDAEGKPIYQQMQGSTNEVIADLVAELQSLRARVAQLESN